MALDEDVTLGVEEECLLVDPGSRALVPASRALLARSRPEVGERAMQHELYLSQVEIGTPVCRTLDQLRGSLTQLPDPAVAPMADRRVDRRLRLQGRPRRAGGQPGQGRRHPGRHPRVVGRAPLGRYPTIEFRVSDVATLAGGPGADRQRAAYARAGRFEDVVDQVVAETAAA